MTVTRFLIRCALTATGAAVCTFVAAVSMVPLVFSLASEDIAPEKDASGS